MLKVESLGRLKSTDRDDKGEDISLAKIKLKFCSEKAKQDSSFMRWESIDRLLFPKPAQASDDSQKVISGPDFEKTPFCSSKKPIELFKDQFRDFSGNFELLATKA